MVTEGLQGRFVAGDEQDGIVLVGFILVVKPGAARHGDGVERLPVEFLPIDNGRAGALESDADQARILSNRRILAIRKDIVKAHWSFRGHYLTDTVALMAKMLRDDI